MEDFPIGRLTNDFFIYDLRVKTYINFVILNYNDKSYGIQTIYAVTLRDCFATFEDEYTYGEKLTANEVVNAVSEFTELIFVLINHGVDINKITFQILSYAASNTAFRDLVRDKKL